MDAGVIKPRSQGFFHFLRVKCHGNEVGCHPQPQESRNILWTVMYQNLIFFWSVCGRESEWRSRYFENGASYNCFAPCKEIQDSLGFWILRRGFRILCQWNLDSGFQSFVGFRIPWAVFQISKPRMSDSTSKIFPESGFHKQKFHGFRIWFLLSRHRNKKSKPFNRSSLESGK